MTVKLSVVAMPLAVLIGLAVAIGRLYGPKLSARLLDDVRGGRARHAAGAAAVRDLLSAAGNRV